MNCFVNETSNIRKKIRQMVILFYSISAVSIAENNFFLMANTEPEKILSYKPKIYLFY